MSDPYRLTDTPAPVQNDGRRPVPAGTRAVRALLWTGIVLAVGLNVAASLADVLLIQIPAGSIAVLCVIGLITSHVRGRR